MFLYWLGLAQILWYMNENFLWDSWISWLFLSLYSIYIMVVMFFQVLILPKVLEWIELAPIQMSTIQEAANAGKIITDIHGNVLNDDHINDPNIWGNTNSTDLFPF